MSKLSQNQLNDNSEKNCELDWGIIFGEAVEAAYENIQGEAANACKNVKPLV